MKLASIGCALALGLTLLSAPISAQESRVATFQIGEKQLRWTLPERYCLPEGKEAGVAQLISNADRENITTLTAVTCKVANPFEHYVLFKTPNPAVLASIERPELIAMLGEEFNKPDFNEQMKAGGKLAQEGLSKALGREMDMKMAIAPMGKDDRCAYLGGQVGMQSGDKSEQVGSGICMTVVNKKLVSIYLFEKYVDAGTVAKLIVQARGIADQLIAQNETEK